MKQINIKNLIYEDLVGKKIAGLGGSFKKYNSWLIVGVDFDDHEPMLELDLRDGKSRIKVVFSLNDAIFVED